MRCSLLLPRGRQFFVKLLWLLANRRHLPIYTTLTKLVNTRYRVRLALRNTRCQLETERQHRASRRLDMEPRSGGVARKMQLGIFVPEHYGKGECRAKELNPLFETRTKFEPCIRNYRDRFCTRQILPRRYNTECGYGRCVCKARTPG